MTEQQQKAAADQQLKLEQLISFIEQGEKEVGLFGKAGVGKTHCAKALVRKISEFLPKKGLTIAGAAISHAAKNILQDSLGDNFTCYTLAALLQTTKVFNDDGSIVFKPVPKWVNGKLIKPPIKSVDILIVDECSQISDSMLALIREHRNSKCITIFLGDWRQTPPPEPSEDGVNRDSLTFDVPHIKLTIPFRYEGELQKLNDAIGNTIDLINLNGSKNLTLSFLKEFVQKNCKEYKFWRNKDDFFNEYKNYLLDEEKNHQSKILISYRNNSVKANSIAIRNILLNNPTEVYDKEDILISASTYYGNKSFGLPEDDLDWTKEFDTSGPILFNSVIYKVQDVEEQTLKVHLVNGKLYGYNDAVQGKTLLRNLSKKEERFFGLSKSYDGAVIKTIDLPIYNITLKHVSGREDDIDIEYKTVPVLKNRDDINYKYLKNHFQHAAKVNKSAIYWKQYYEFADYFANLQYAYAVNTYKVQGSTYDIAFVDLRDILSVNPISAKEKLQSFYTALTRARSEVQILI